MTIISMRLFSFTMSLLFLFTNSAIAGGVDVNNTGSLGEWSGWQSYSKPVDYDGEKWVEIDLQTRITSSGSVFAGWRIKNLSIYTLSRVSVADKEYTLKSGRVERISGGANSSLALANGESYTFSPEIVSLVPDPINFVILDGAEFGIEFTVSPNKTMEITGYDFSDGTIRMKCAPYQSDPRIVDLKIEIKGSTLIMKDERGRTNIVRIRDGLRNGDRTSVRMIDSELQAASEVFCGDKITSSSWTRSVFNSVMGFLDKKETEAYKQCKIDNADTWKDKCILGCVTKFCNFKRNTPDGKRG